MSTEIIQTEANHNIIVGPQIAEGGHGVVRRAVIRETSEQGIVKVYHPSAFPKDDSERIRFQINHGFNRLSPAIKAPTEKIRESHGIGYFAPFAPGRPLSEALDPQALTYSQILTIGAGVAQTTNVFHSRGIGVGDIRLENFHLHMVGARPEIYMYDLDNFYHKDAPPPTAFGDLAYMAPEVRTLMLQGKRAFPDIEADRFSLAVVMMEIFLFKHPTTGHDETPEKYAEAMWEDRWLHDPYSGKAIACDKGLPSAVLNSSMANMTRKGLSRNRGIRTTASEWVDGILAGYKVMRNCERCGGPMFNDATKTVCPYCKQPFPDRFVVCPDGRRMQVNCGDVRIGRVMLKSQLVSDVHVVCRKIGIDCYMEHHGRNPTWKLVRGQPPHPLERGKPISVERGDVFRLADVHVRIE